MKFENIREKIIINAVSSLIGASVSLLFYPISGTRFSIITYLFLGAGAGLTIGLCSTQLFLLVISRFYRRPFLPFLAVALSIAAGTFCWSFLLSRSYSPIIWLIVAAAELLGMGATFLIWLHTKKLNLRLKQKQSDLELKISENK